MPLDECESETGTAGDRIVNSGSPDPADAKFADRVADSERKHRLIADFLQQHRYDALLLRKPGNFAWLTSGADNTRAGSAETTACLFVTPTAKVVVTNSVDSVQLFEAELTGLGFQLKQRAWHESRSVLVEDLCRGRIVASDGGFPGTRDVSVHLAGMRLPMTQLEVARLRELGRRLVHSVEATARNCRPQQTEAELAGEVAHRLIKRRVVPVRIQVAADGRIERFRHWSYGKNVVRHSAVISAVGRWHGLHLGVTRTVSFDPPAQHLRENFNRNALMLATGMAFSRDEWELSEVWKRVKRIYEKFGVPNEWHLAEQAEITAYEPTEVPLVPKSEFTLAAGMPMFWHPSVGPALAGESILVRDNGYEWLTPTEFWPRMTVQVKGMQVPCPGIFVCNPTGSPSEADYGFDSAAADSEIGSIADESGSHYDLSAIVVE